MSAPRSERPLEEVPVRRRWFDRALLLALVLVVFGRILTHAFLAWDDVMHVVNNSALRPASWERVVGFWREPFKGLWAPLAYTYWSGLVWLTEGTTGVPRAPLDPRWFAVGQLALHAVCVGLVHGLLGRLGCGRVARLVGAALFAVHPLQVESVAWLSEARGLLAAVWSLAALALFLRWRSAERRGFGVWLAGTVCLGLALASKPSAVVTPLLALLLARARGERWRASAMAALPWLALTGGFAARAAGFQEGDDVAQATPLLGRGLVALDALGHYFHRLVLPSGLSPDHGRTPELVLAAGWWRVAPLVGALSALWLGLALPRARPLALGAALLVAALLPVLGLVPFDHQQISTVADRYVYLGMLGPALVAARLVDGRPALARVGIGLVTGLAHLSFVQTGRWRDERTLFEHALRVHPESRLAHMQLGLEAEAAHDLTRARRHFETALALDPREAKAWTSLGNLAFEEGDPRGALEAYGRSLALRPRGPVARANERRLERELERLEAQVSELAPTAAAGDARARRQLANALEGSGRFEEARLAYDGALEAKPDWAAVAGELAWLLAAAPIEDVRDPERALALIGDASSPRALWTRSIAERSVPEGEAALAAALAAENAELAARIRGWLAMLERAELPRGLRR